MSCKAVVNDIKSSKPILTDTLSNQTSLEFNDGNKTAICIVQPCVIWCHD